MFYGCVGVSHPDSEHPPAADMTGYRDPPNMTVIGDEWNDDMRWEMSRKRFYRKLDDNHYYDMDDIGKLGYLACHGSRSAATHLRRYYSEGPAEDPDKAYKYACYAALAWDRESVGILRSEGKLVRTFFMEDIDLDDWIIGRRDPTRPIEDLGRLIVCPIRSDVPCIQSDASLNAGYRHPDSFGSHEYLSIELIRPEDLPKRNPIPFRSGFMFHEEWPTSGDVERWIRKEPFSDEFDEIDARFFRDVFQYFGIGTERDEDAAIRDLLDMFKEGISCNAAEMISYAIGYEPEAFLARFPDRSDVEAGPMSGEDPDDSRRMYYRVADWKMLEDSPEWRILSMLTRIDSGGLCKDPDRSNGEGGYEDDVMFTRADSKSVPRPPTFVFKPSGYSMGWGGYAWLCPEQSENLSMGEIRRVMRLCIEHLAYGREIPKGPTKELISAPMHLYAPPEDIRKDLEEAARGALSNHIGRIFTWWPRTFSEDDSWLAEQLAREILSEMGKEHSERANNGPVAETDMARSRIPSIMSDEDGEIQRLIEKAGQGDPEAQNTLGCMYMDGDGVPQSDEEAVRLFRLSAEHGNPTPQFNLGLMYVLGRGVEQSYEEAARLFRLSAEQGDTRAQNNLGMMYREGRGVPQSYEEALKWFEESAGRYDPHGLVNLGLMYENGTGVEQSDEEAFSLYEDATILNDGWAWGNLGRMYELGKGVEQSSAEAARCFEKAAAKGDVESQFYLGSMYIEGKGVPQSYEKAAALYRKAAEQGDAASQYNLGYMYENGTGVPQSYEDAAAWYRLSAEQGDVWAQVGLGMLYDDGTGVEQSYEEAVAWYRKAAEQGYADAQFLLGRMYEDGTGVEQSLDEAIGWYRKAADQGNVPAQERLAELDGQSGERCRPYYGRVDVSHPHSEHPGVTDMG